MYPSEAYRRFILGDVDTLRIFVCNGNLQILWQSDRST